MTDIKDYWDDRAKTAPANAKTTNDVYLRKLEAALLAAELDNLQLPAGAAVLDVGCGDGQTILTLAERFPGLQFRGIDFSPEMISAAQTALSLRADSFRHRIAFGPGDVRDIDAVAGKEKFAAILSNRCLINLSNADEQYGALRQIADHLDQNGAYLGTENFVGGQNELNRLRRTLGLPAIAIRWHNLFFDEKSFMATARTMFRSVELTNFSSAYYYVTRVVYSALCQLQERQPDYEDPVHAVAIKLPSFGDFSPVKFIRARA
jgi:SAM-dependent methyltransferase